MAYDEHGFDEEAWARVVLQRPHAYTAEQIKDAEKILGVAASDDLDTASSRPDTDG